jgi:hypothetical protein
MMNGLGVDEFGDGTEMGAKGWAEVSGGVKLGTSLFFRLRRLMSIFGPDT